MPALNVTASRDRRDDRLPGCDPHEDGRGKACGVATFVIASAAKQSIGRQNKYGLLRRFVPRNGDVPGFDSRGNSLSKRLRHGGTLLLYAIFFGAIVVGAIVFRTENVMALSDGNRPGAIWAIARDNFNYRYWDLHTKFGNAQLLGIVNIVVRRLPADPRSGKLTWIGEPVRKYPGFDDTRSSIPGLMSPEYAPHATVLSEIEIAHFEAARNGIFEPDSTGAAVVLPFRITNKPRGVSDRFGLPFNLVEINSRTLASDIGSKRVFECAICFFENTTIAARRLPPRLSCRRPIFP